MPGASAVSAMLCLVLVPPLALRLDPDRPRLLRVMGPVAGGIAATAALVPRGPESALLAAAFLVFALWNLAWSFGRFLATESTPGPAPWAAAVGGVGPVVAAVAWLSSRATGTFAGFPEPLASLTVPHFTVTFWLLPVALAAWTHGLRKSRGAALRRAGLWGVTLLPALTGALFALRSEPMIPSGLEVALTWGMAGALGLWWLGARAAPSLQRSRQGRPVRVAAAVLAVGTAFGAAYATSMATGLPWLGIGGMLATHGIANLLAVVVLAALAPGLVPLPRSAPAPDTSLPALPGNPTLAVLVDKKSEVLGPDSPAGFAAVAARVQRGELYPLSVMERRAAFLDEGRAARAGEVLSMALLFPTAPGLPPVRLPAQVRVHLAESSDDEVSFGYSTTAAHYGRGQWELRLKREDGWLKLELESHLRPSRWFLWPGLLVYRRLQQRAVRSGIAGLRQLVKGQPTD
jgi:hypothetical protein